MLIWTIEMVDEMEGNNRKCTLKFYLIIFTDRVNTYDENVEIKDYLWFWIWTLR